ncbi:protein mono-ADP-ribosyltransferase PARP10 [Varanus komodoensis]|uniref:protein mono-ADP-ribosyltransferase PARP10 n=1 Tax=Varanus komodoensis TaxID=61221 RepID=UPI001CF7926C|nr:protein mono-ADP-ribosyltransferase PARP10 [Varanus komodoensis]
MAPRDCSRALLRGVAPQTSSALLESYMEHVLGAEAGSFSVLRGRARDLALVQLRRPLSEAEFAAVAEQVQHRALDGASVELDWVEQTDSVLVQGGAGGQLSQDLLELYFESRRGGGGRVRAVRLLSGGTTAVVTFEDSAAVEQVLQRPHQLLDGPLAVSPYYDFLEPAEEVEAGGNTPAEDGADSPICIPALPATTQRLLQSELVLQELAAAVPGCTVQREGTGLRLSSGEAARRQELQEHVLAALQGVVQEHKPLSSWALAFLQQEEVQGRLAELLATEGVAACYVPAADEVLVAALQPSAAHRAAALLDTFLCPLALPLSERQLPALVSPRWARLQAELPCCQVRLAEDGQELEGLTLLGLEHENMVRLEAFLQDCMPEEVVVPMEASALRFLQLYRHEVLAGIADVSLLPLEGADITGFRLSGEARACQAAAELLQSLLCALRTETVALELPGVRRFLRDERGQALVRKLEKRFRGVVGLERVDWRPPEAQHPLERSQDPLFLNCQRDSLPGLGQPCGSGGGADGGSTANMEVIRGLLAALQPPGMATDGAPLGPEEPAAMEEDTFHLAPEQAEAEGALASEEAAAGSLEGGLLPLAGPGASASEEEAAQLLLAIQQSMDSAWQEEAELQRAIELSLGSWSWEQPPGLGTPPPGASPEAAHVAQVVLCMSAEDGTAALARELEQALSAQLQEETVRHEALSTLPAPCQGYLAHLERKHAVRILRAGAAATACGFLDYPMAATRDLALLLARVLPAEAAPAPQGGEGPSWVRWEAAGRDSPTPYSAQASALLEWAWRRGHRHLDVVFGEQLFHFDLERMEERDLANARALPISRAKAPPAAPPAPADPPALSEEAKLVLLTEDSAEFQETVRDFCATLELLRSKISVVKVEKLLHPLLYQQYCLKKAAMEQACRQQQQVERVLYHGTTEQASREICQHGFNRSFCGRNATRYGCGVYFATRSFLSVHEQYSPCSSDGSKFVFVARTLVGDYTRGSPGMRAPPLRDGDTAPRRYDSTVDNPDHPSIFVIFNDTQAYPQYLLTCRWSQPQ